MARKKYPRKVEKNGDAKKLQGENDKNPVETTPPEGSAEMPVDSNPTGMSGAMAVGVVGGLGVDGTVNITPFPLGNSMNQVNLKVVYEPNLSLMTADSESDDSDGTSNEADHHPMDYGWFNASYYHEESPTAVDAETLINNEAILHEDMIQEGLLLEHGDDGNTLSSVFLIQIPITPVESDHE